MVEFLLIFALGFLAAAMIGMLITPAIYGRIVKLTEKRIEATVPLSAAEIKGKSDLLRAGFASETAKLSTQLEKERENLAAREWANNKLQTDLANLAGEKTEADQTIAELVTQSADMRSDARKQQQLIDKLSGTVTDFERMKRADTEEINRLNNDLMAISTEVESMKIDLATSGTETVSLRSEISSLEDQRQKLQSDIKSIADTAHDLQEEHQLEQERHNNSRIELAATQSTLADAEMQLGHAKEEIEALQQVNQELQDDARAIADTAHELQETHSLEQKSHDETRRALSEKQSELVEHQAALVQSTEKIEAQLEQLHTLTEAEQQGAQALDKAEWQIVTLTEELESTQAELEKSRVSAAEIKEAFGLERKDHKSARGKLDAKQAALAESQAALEQLGEKNEEQLKQLRTLTEAERRGAQALKKTEQQIETLTGKLENTRAELEKSRISAAEIKEAFGLEQKDHKSVRSELAAKQAMLAERKTELEDATEKNREQLKQLRALTEAERQGAQALKKAEQQIETLTDKLESTRAALEKSRNSAAELKERISGLNASEKQRLKDAAIAADRLKDLEIRLHEEHSNSRQRATELEAARKTLDAGDRKSAESRAKAAELEQRLNDEVRQVDETDASVENLSRELEDARAESDQTHSAQQRAERRGTELETQVGALKDALQKSREMSGEFRQQLNKMRREVHQLNRTNTANRNDRPAEDEAARTEHPGPAVTGNGIGRAMQSDQTLKSGVEELRARQKALMSDLNSGNTGEDDRLREEIADIAALAVGLSAHRGGQLSPVHKLISEPGSTTPRTSDRKSLAERARAQLEN